MPHMKQIFIGLDIAKVTGWAWTIYDVKTGETTVTACGTRTINCQRDLVELLGFIVDTAPLYIGSPNPPIVVICPLPTSFRYNLETQFKMLGVIELWAETRNIYNKATAVVAKVDNHMRKEVFGTIKYPEGVISKKYRRAYRKKIILDRYREHATNDDEADALMFIEYYKNYVNKNDT